MYYPNVKLAVVDDHTLFRKGLISLIEFAGDNYEILFEADNGIDLQKKIDAVNLPDIILLDISMPVMDGFETAVWLKKHHPPVKILAISMMVKEEAIVGMLKLGVNGFLSKDVEPEQLRDALEAIINKGFYYTDFITGNLVHSLQHEGNEDLRSMAINSISDREMEFLHLACSEMTYKELANLMNLSERTIDGYREALFEKFKVQSRVGLCLEALRKEMVSL